MKNTNGLPWCLSGEESACQSRRAGSDPCPGRSHLLWSNEAQVPHNRASAPGPRTRAASPEPKSGSIRSHPSQGSREARPSQLEKSPTVRSKREARSSSEDAAQTEMHKQMRTF
ncbi:unnamed protein product [Rangifer tarandus platyrhynchus]|uniref:Uncharacterized protein n=2 Tax=Rangifer tarandus platyrhynchus TaxID=3082113 RepID=A0ABN8Y3N0_RANTA|nr:unnamed protein product [Rangifer tarandus platyrhynchus]